MINSKKCIGCGTCLAICPVEAIKFNQEGKAQINESVCVKCGACQSSCPVDAIEIY